MQTFLPYKNFYKSLDCLDNKRLGCQRKEAFQILNVLSGKSDGWKNHPAVKMWRGYEGALKFYYNTSLLVWKQRGYQNIKLQPIDVCANEIEAPLWIGNEDFHNSHRCNLIRKKPEHYIPIFGNLNPSTPYYWPL